MTETVIDERVTQNDDVNEYEDIVIKKLRWHSRRGMLELDLIFMPFIEEQYVKLAVNAQANYRELLACEDQDLFAWFVKKEACSRADLVSIVAEIMEWYAQR